MTTLTAPTVPAALRDLLDATDYPWHLSRWGAPQITLPDEGYAVRITEDDGTYYLTVLSGGPAELIHTEASFSGIAAQGAPPPRHPAAPAAPLSTPPGRSPRGWPASSRPAPGAR